MKKSLFNLANLVIVFKSLFRERHFAKPQAYLIMCKHNLKLLGQFVLH